MRHVKGFFQQVPIDMLLFSFRLSYNVVVVVARSHQVIWGVGKYWSGNGIGYG